MLRSHLFIRRGGLWNLKRNQKTSNTWRPKLYERCIGVLLQEKGRWSDSKLHVLSDGQTHILFIFSQNDLILCRSSQRKFYCGHQMCCWYDSLISVRLGLSSENNVEDLFVQRHPSRPPANLTQRGRLLWLYVLCQLVVFWNFVYVFWFQNGHFHLRNMSNCVTKFMDHM